MVAGGVSGADPENCLDNTGSLSERRTPEELIKAVIASAGDPMSLPDCSAARRSEMLAGKRLFIGTLCPGQKSGAEAMTESCIFTQAW